MLGNWVPQDGLVLTTNDSIYPQWVSEKQVIDSELVNTLEYKFVTINPSTGACFWEDIANRIIDLAPYSNDQEHDLMVEDAGFNHNVEQAPSKIHINTVTGK